MAYIFTITLVATLWGIIKPFSLGDFKPSRAQFALAFFASFVGIAAFAPEPDDNQSGKDGLAKTSPDAVEGNSDAAQPDPLDDYKGQLGREIASMRDANTLTDIPEDRDGVFLQLAVIGARAKIYEDRPEHDDADLGEMEREFIDLSVAYQRDAFPKLRKAWAEALDAALWENDIDVAAIGSRNSRLRFTGGVFASNRGIKAVRDGLEDAPSILRFKEERYEWYRGSEYQYWTYDDRPQDGDWARMTNSGWVAFD